MIADDIALGRDIEELGAATREAIEALDEAKPSPGRLERAGRALIAAAEAILRYCAHKADLMVSEASKELGKGVGKWAVPAAIAIAGSATPLGQELIQFAREVLPNLK